MIAFKRVVSLFLFTGLLAGCSGMDISGPNTFKRADDKWQQVDEKRETVFGEGGITFGGDDNNRRSQGGTGIGVNAFLWRATLDTISFMPLASADPFGGVVLTDWHMPSTATNERYKLNVYILDQALRADGIRVAAFRQVRSAETNEWLPVAMDPKAITDIENAILTRARQLRTESLTQ